MNAAILAVGSELLGTDRLDTNSLYLTGLMRRHGVEVVQKGVVGDREEEIGAALARLMERAELVVVCGGLGPTADDVTRAAVARELKRPLRLDEQVLETIRGRFEQMDLSMPESNRRQAEVIEGARLLDNRRGTAPGQWLEVDGVDLLLLPGVPAELREMAASDLDPWLERRSRSGGFEERTLRVACLAESAIEERLGQVYERFGREALALLASPGEVLVKGTAGGAPDDRRERLDAIEAEVRDRLGDTVFAVGETRLEEVVGSALASRRETVATGESCTGGLVAERLTRVPGSSDWMRGGVVAYSNSVKTGLLGVEPSLLETQGAVSRAVAEALARGARDRLEADWGIGVTGIAGPGGGTRHKPVGTVHVALVGPPGRGPAHRRLLLPGSRSNVRQLTSQWALDMLRRALEDRPQLPATGSSPEYSG